MENIDAKLSSDNPALISKVFSLLLENVINKNKGSQEAFLYLKTKCLGENSVTSDVARVSILKLIEKGALQMDQTLAEFVASISTASNVTSLAKMLTSLLYLQLSQKPAEINRLQLTQHPIVRILQAECRFDVQISIYNDIIQSCFQDPSLSLSVNTLYGPLYLFCICSPVPKTETSLLKQKLWTFLVKFDEDNDTSFIFKLSCWLQIQGKNAQLASGLLDEALQSQLTRAEPLKNLDYLILTQILGICNMAQTNADFRPTIRTVLLLLPKVTFPHCNLSILLFSKAVLVCSPLYLEELLQLCYYLVNHNTCQPYSFFALKFSLLHWLASSCELTQKALGIADNIIKLQDHVCRKRPLIMVNRLNIDRFPYLTFCNPNIFLTLEMCIKVECTKENEMSTLLYTFEEAPLYFLNNNFTFLCGMLLYNKLDAKNKITVLALIVKCACHYLELMPAVLTLILSQLSNCDDNRLQFELLKALPHMAKVRENIPKVVAIIQAISKQSTTSACFALRLMYDTWKIENKCYSALEIISFQSPAILKDEIWEQNVSKAYIYKKLSEDRPELYGKDLVAHLSKILNECTTSDGAIPSALAIEGIRHLCKAEVIDIVTTWVTLSPKFRGDTRVPVIKSLCELLSEIPDLEYTQSYERLNDEVIQHLWSYVTMSDNEDIIQAALDALANFSLDMLSMHIPEVYLDEHHIGQSSSADQRVPGKTWLKFLTTCKSKVAARAFVTKLARAEIENFLKYVYQLKSQREPHNYASLPTHSVVRALGEFVKNNYLKVSDLEGSLFVDCLTILSAKYPKPLPPLDWNFLQEIVHVPAMKEHCLDLASHQAVLSGSARRLMENYIVAVTENPTLMDCVHVYRNLKYLANSIQPMIFEPFFQNSLHVALQTVDNDSVFAELLGYLKNVLDDDEVQEVNKSVIEGVLTEIVLTIDATSKPFFLILDHCLGSFSPKGQEGIAKFNFDDENFSAPEFGKITRIRCLMSQKTKSESSLVWLNDIFTVASRYNVKPPLYYEDLVLALKKNLNHKESPTWLHELLGEIQAKVADRCDIAEIQHFCDMLALAVVYFSGLFVILPKHDYHSIKYFFPAALAFLVEEPMWSIYASQILEWLHYMNKSESIPHEYQLVFGWALASLRHEEEFSKNSKWMKYLDCQIYNDSA